MTRSRSTVSLKFPTLRQAAACEIEAAKRSIPGAGVSVSRLRQRRFRHASLYALHHANHCADGVSCLRLPMALPMS